MEQLIEAVESLENGQKKQLDMGLSVDEDLLSTSRKMRWEAEWFVQHVCERLRERDAKVLWGPVLRKMGAHELCIATSNYDRSIEIACNYNGVAFDDGFEELSETEAAMWRGIESVQNGKLKLLKVHGSTDWYMGSDEVVYKLRHPMPLYGNLALSFGDHASSNGPQMTSAMILPTREKLSTQPPYPDVTTDLRNVVREAEVAIFVGTSLRDPDLRDICRQSAGRVPTYVVTLDSGTHGPDVPGVRTIIGTASGFLTSTLPRFLTSGQTDYLDGCADGSFEYCGERVGSQCAG